MTSILLKSIQGGSILKSLKSFFVNQSSGSIKLLLAWDHIYHKMHSRLKSVLLVDVVQIIIMIMILLSVLRMLVNPNLSIFTVVMDMVRMHGVMEQRIS